MKQSGFTVVELITVVTVLSILATLAIVGFGTWQRNIAASQVASDTSQAVASMKIFANRYTNYPTSLDELSSSFEPSDGVSMSLTTSGGSGLPVYSNLSDVQNGVLFHSICGDLISEGYAVGTNQGGQQEQYISGCNVYNHPQIQVNSAWTSRSFDTSIQSSVLPNVVASINYNDSWRPNRDQIEQDFYQAWHDRFTEQGGTYPVQTFWDPWCTGVCTWGVQLSPLPTPSGTSGGATSDFCIQANSQRYHDIAKHAGPDGQVIDGAC